jgi:hypothetical protein
LEQLLGKLRRTIDKTTITAIELHDDPASSGRRELFLLSIFTGFTCR